MKEKLLPMLLLYFLLLALFVVATNAEPASSKLQGCSVNGIYLKGRVQVVSAFGDVKIREVGTGADLQVRIVDLPQSCGEWRFVDSLPDFTVEYVSIGEDITVKISR